MVSISSALPQLANLTVNPPSSQFRPIRLGGQDFNHCYLLALNDSLNFRAGSLSFRQPSYIPDLTTNEFMRAVNQGHFPCGAPYTGDYSGAPEVRVPYDWCANRCDGWQISHRDALTQWIGPLVGFILPCIAFSLSIPRSSKLSVPSWIFKPGPNQTMGLLASIIRFPPALFIVALDTILWLSICFAFAGPMLLSGIYEAYLDHRLLTILDQNIRIDTEISTKHIHVDEVTSLIEDIGPDSPSDNIMLVKARLQALLASQMSFGSAVGAPVVFFIGSFIYNLIDIRSKLGDNDTTHTLAFGMWWMIVPELAIMSCLLLAANNPSALHGILGRPVEQETITEKDNKCRWKSLTVFGWSEGDVNMAQRNQIANLDRNLRMSTTDWFRSWAAAFLLLLTPCLLAVLTS
ncbi:hypothetical protein JX266_004747 [Neoarthrinium moseri]|nr:hypothetical protein JX266_004747 [Neoarthrinium moseri]